MLFNNNLKTSDKISLKFAVFNFFSLLILLVSINVIYFFIWYSDQKQESLFDLNQRYTSYIENVTDSGALEFRDYILEKDSLIYPVGGGDPIGSSILNKRINNDISSVEGRNFFVDNEKIFLIFSKDYPDIGEVRVFFDTTTYIKSQIIITKISLVIILLSFLFTYFLSKMFSEYLFRDLRKICVLSQTVSVKNFSNIEFEGPDDDEIRIIADTINRSYSRLKKQADDQQQFITDVSHEFKTPLMVINSKIDLYNKRSEKGLAGVDDLKTLHSNIKYNTAKLNKLLETLFLLSRKNNSLDDLELEMVNLSDYIKKFSKGMLNNLVKGELNIDYKIDKKIYRKIDRTTFNIILENFLTNAVKFSEGNMNFEIGLTKNCFYVRDFGAGMTEADQKKIWKKFFRKDTKIEGFGVGLFLVKRIVDMYGWSIIVDSKVGKGTTFTVNF